VQVTMLRSTQPDFRRVLTSAGLDADRA